MLATEIMQLIRLKATYKLGKCIVSHALCSVLFTSSAGAMRGMVVEELSTKGSCPHQACPTPFLISAAFRVNCSSCRITKMLAADSEVEYQPKSKKAKVEEEAEISE